MSHSQRRSSRRPAHALRLSGAIAASVAIVAAIAAAGPAGAQRVRAHEVAPERVGSAPRIAQSATVLGGLSPSTRLSVTVVLKPRDPAELAAFAAEVSTPGDALYGHYLERGQFATRFGATAAAIRAVRASLAERGLSGGHVAGDHLAVEYTARAGTLGRAFAVSFERYRLASGRTAFANTTAPLLAGSVAREVQGVIGLDDLVRQRPLGLERAPASRAPAARPHVATGGPQPCATAVADAPGNFAYTADELAAAYGFSSLYQAGDEGAGTSVAIFELESNSKSDIAAYQKCYGTDAAVSYTEVDGFTGSGAGSGEAALDIEDVIGLAPKASIDVYQAPNSNAGVYDDYSAIVSDDTSQVVTTSWGECEAESSSTILSEEATLFETAATQGQTVLAAAGDDGSEDCGTTALGVDDPGSQEYVTSVGGTTLEGASSAPSETVWNESVNQAGAGGGGISAKHAMPSYQADAPAGLNVVNSHSSASPCKASAGTYCREVPDVSADADPYTGYLVYWDGSWTGIGGTSAAAPLWAAFMALTDASSGCDATAVGFANPALYDAAATAYSSDFNDITSGNNDYTGTQKGLYPAGTGYDMASGLGTPRGGALAGTLCAGLTHTPADTTTTVSAAPEDPVVGQPVTLTATVAPVAPATRTPTGTVTFSSAGSTLCVATLDDESPDTASCSISEPSAATVTIGAVYNGDADDETSTAGTPASLSVGAAATTTTVTAGVTSAVYHQTVGFTATVAVVSPGAGTPTGTVAFTVASKTCDATLSGSVPDVATCNVELPSVGSKSFKATFEGSDDFTESTSSTGHVAVSAAATTTSLSASSSPSVSGQSVTFSAAVAAVAPSAGTPGGHVTFSLSGSGGQELACTGTSDVKGLKAGVATCKVSGTGLSPAVSPLTVVATYDGTASYVTSDATIQQVIDRASASVTVTASHDPANKGEAVAFTVSVRARAPGGGAVTGRVRFSFSPASTLACRPGDSVRLSGSDTATCTIAAKALTSSVTVTASYGGSSSYKAAKGKLTETVS